MSKQALAEPDITVRDALSEAVRVFNEREMIRGYSPIQHALGRAPDASGRLFPRAGGDSPDLLVENANGEFHRNLERMKVAEQAFLDWNNEQRVQRALNSKGRGTLDFQPGDLVYVWRQQVSGQASVKGGSFVGPVRVLATEHRHSSDGSSKASSSVWCVRGRRLWKCSMEQLRHASERGKLLHELHGPVESSWDFHRVAAELGGNEYLDVSKEVPTEMEWETAQDPVDSSWIPTHRCRGKRGPPVTQMEVDPLDCPQAQESGRTTRSRSPRQRAMPSTPQHKHDTFAVGESWWENPMVQQACSVTESMQLRSLWRCQKIELGQNELSMTFRLSSPTASSAEPQLKFLKNT